MKKQEKVQQASSSQNHLSFTRLLRCAGVLLAVSSLPSRFGVGDFGPEAYRFADFLQRAHQTVWQILPLNSSSAAQGFSPYGSNGAFAGNTILISPEWLARDGLLSEKNLADYTVKGNEKTDYDKAQKAKAILLDTAFVNFKSKNADRREFDVFCKEESFWLDDYALYIALKKENENKSWNQWDEAYKNANPDALQTFAKAHQDELERIKWQQWIFDKQWYELKSYCNGLGIKILGDIPFYVAYDSADVWRKRSMFHLDEKGNMLTEGGAPPDNFNAEGQRWGFPVYCWDVLKKENYEWWVNRLKKNAAWFDFTRLDHFRGFSAYWDIPVKAKSAKKGKWMPSPGKEFFSLLLQDMGSLPFVAEDLGSISEEVIQLRNEFNLPGMIIQQVAFAEDMPQSTSIPHHHYTNAVVYTGNHDNNTLIGWYKSLPKEYKKNITSYLDKKVSKENICEVMERLVYASVAKLAVIPMQDILQLDADARMNSVPDGGHSWSWKMPVKSLTKKTEDRLKTLCFLYDRSPAK